MLAAIDNYLVEFTTHIKQNNQSGKYDINKNSEYRAINLLNIIYGYDLENANKVISDNFPAIDLIDYNKRVAVQVTSTTSKDKLTYTLEKFVEKGLYNSIDKLIIYILTDKQERYNDKSIEEINNITKSFIKFDIKKDIIDNKDLGSIANNFSNITHIKKLYNYLIEEFERSEIKEKSFPKELNAFASYDFKSLIGRKSTLNDINEKFQDSNIVLLHGIGGIGKTAIVKSFLEKNREYYSHVAYVQVNDSLLESLFQTLVSVDSSFNYDKSQDLSIKMYNLINKLRLIENTLLVIDNCNKEDDLRKFKPLIESLKWKVLISSRSLPQTYNKETIKINHLSPDESFSLFLSNYGKSLDENDDYIIKSILSRINYHTKLIILLAKAAFNNDLLKLEEMAEKINGEHYNDEKINIRVSLDSEEYPVYEFILLLFSPEDLSTDQQKYLKYFSVLYSQEISVEHLVKIFEQDKRQGYFIDLINKLSEKGWIEKYGTFYRIHPLIQLVTKHKLSISYDDCQDLIKNVSLYLNESNNYINNSLYSSYGDSIVDYFRQENKIEVAIICNYLSIINMRLYRLQRARHFSNEAIKIFEFAQNSEELLAQSYGNMGSICASLNLYEDAEFYLLKALNLQKSILPEGDRDIAATYSNIVSLYLTMGRAHEIQEDLFEFYYNKVLFYSQKSLDIQIFHWNKFHIIHDGKNLATTYVILATVYNDLYRMYQNSEYLELSLQYDDKALILKQNLLGINHPDTATSYNNAGLSYLEIGNLLKAKEYIEKSFEIRLNILPQGHPDLGFSLYNLSRVHNQLNDRERSIEFVLRAIDIFEQSVSRDHPTLIAARELLAGL